MSAVFDIAVTNQQTRHAVYEEQLRAAAHAVLSDSDLLSAAISIAVVDDPTIHELNRRYLDHDWPTDVLSFVLENDGRHLQGEVIFSADTAAAAAAELGWPTAAEQLLYVVHGMLHLVGHDDKTADQADQMRAAEANYLRQLGFEPPAEKRGGQTHSAGAETTMHGGAERR
jgi:probable rRNA maturation factor